jgi:hypothetical protein
VPKRHHRYGERTGGNLTYAGWDGLLAGFARIMAGCVAMLRPGGTAVITSRPVRRNPDDLIDLPGLLLDAATAAGLEPVERCAALLAAVKDGRLVHRASMFALLAVPGTRRWHPGGARGARRRVRVTQAVGSPPQAPPAS